MSNEIVLQKIKNKPWFKSWTNIQSGGYFPISMTFQFLEFRSRNKFHFFYLFFFFLLDWQTQIIPRSKKKEKRERNKRKQWEWKIISFCMTRIQSRLIVLTTFRERKKPKSEIENRNPFPLYLIQSLWFDVHVISGFNMNAEHDSWRMNKN